MIPVAMALAVQLTIPVADKVPHYNVQALCRGIARPGDFGLSLGLEPHRSAQQDFNSCMKSEMAVRRRLVKRWSTFKAADRADCVGEASAGGIASYTDLLTCLQLTSDASRIGR
jgi:hypothetical protein